MDRLLVGALVGVAVFLCLVMLGTFAAVIATEFGMIGIGVIIGGLTFMVGGAACATDGFRDFN